MMVSTDTKIRQLLQSGKIPKKTREILDDITKKKVVWGDFTLSQVSLVDRIYSNVFPQIDQSTDQSININMCKKCNDVGVVMVKHGEYTTLAICDEPTEGKPCSQGKNQVWKLPKASLVSEKSFPLPWEHFKPKDFDPKNPVSSMREKIAWWKEKVKTAEGYWVGKDVNDATGKTD